MPVYEVLRSPVVALTAHQAPDALEALRPHVSADHYATAQLLLSGGVAR